MRPVVPAIAKDNLKDRLFELLSLLLSLRVFLIIGQQLEDVSVVRRRAWEDVVFRSLLELLSQFSSLALGLHDQLKVVFDSLIPRRLSRPPLHRRGFPDHTSWSTKVIVHLLMLNISGLPGATVPGFIIVVLFRDELLAELTWQPQSGRDTASEPAEESQPS